VHVRPAGVGDEQVPVVGTEAHSVRVADAAKNRDRIGVVAGARVGVDEDAVRDVVAGGEPAAVPAEREPVREVESLSRDDLGGTQRPTGPDRVPRDHAGPVVAHEHPAARRIVRIDQHRPGAVGSLRVGTELLHPRDAVGRPGGRQPEHGDTAGAVADNKRLLVEKVEPVRLGERGRRELLEPRDGHLGPGGRRGDLDVGDGDPLVVEGGDRQPPPAGREPHVLRPPERLERRPYVRGRVEGDLGKRRRGAYGGSGCPRLQSRRDHARSLDHGQNVLWCLQLEADQG
jgi:hypothetical protein